MLKSTDWSQAAWSRPISAADSFTPSGLMSPEL